MFKKVAGSTEDNTLESLCYKNLSLIWVITYLEVTKKPNEKNEITHRRDEDVNKWEITSFRRIRNAGSFIFYSISGEFLPHFIPIFPAVLLLWGKVIFLHTSLPSSHLFNFSYPRHCFAIGDPWIFPMWLPPTNHYTPKQCTNHQAR